MKSTQKGSGMIVGIVVVLLVLAGLLMAYYWKKPVVLNNPNPIATTTPVLTGSNNDSKPTTSNGNTGSGTQTNVVTNNVFPGGSLYQSPFGLVLPFPANWQAYAVVKSNPSYGGFQPTDSSTIVLSGGSVLTINVFTKEQWNKIRTEENAANQNVNSLGEGEYLGENSTYIYSYIIEGNEVEVRQVLNNVIRF